LNRRIQTVFMMTDYKWFYISSTIIKEAAALNGKIDGLVPEIVNQRLKEKFGFIAKDGTPVPDKNQKNKDFTRKPIWE